MLQLLTKQRNRLEISKTKRSNTSNDIKPQIELSMVEYQVQVSHWAWLLYCEVLQTRTVEVWCGWSINVETSKGTAVYFRNN